MSADDKHNDRAEEELRYAAEAADQDKDQDKDQDNQDNQDKGAAEEAEETSPESEVDALKAQAQDFQEQMLRSQAEMQNVRRRAEIDVEKAHKFALEKFVKELLPVADSLEKAVESTEGHQEAGEQVASIREGVEMTLNLFMNSLKKFNVEQLDPVGEPFDPQKHEALSMVPAPNAEPNSVVSVVQKGYMLNDRLVRPAMVMVAKAESSPKIDEQA
ncbi:nucleotide exchange factor GrpE [Marinobacter panjinensis]|uniref:Protein GrpE n=1 Tax=Marinobacter panjinensis TaxID=2576384 RepID=A0A4U6R3V4_9GAMM|nr:nucleotide exchange factor GrpE [Marinobacter panjinensis]MCR8916201.1 nucleotide exchange factor GrpE [Marinobacter panjinensis]TKV68330.1 nucleotide exchange factor GrpE [Marinobacter panjinensis]